MYIGAKCYLREKFVEIVAVGGRGRHRIVLVFAVSFLWVRRGGVGSTVEGRSKDQQWRNQSVLVKSLCSSSADVSVWMGSAIPAPHSISSARTPNSPLVLIGLDKPKLHKNPPFPLLSFSA